VPPSLPGRADRLAGSCGGRGAREQAFAWTAPATGPYVLTARGSPAAVVHVHEGTCSGAELGCAAGTLSLDLAEGQEVVVVVDGATQSSDELGVGIEFSAPVCAGACEGTPNGGVCWCDPACAGLGDCCIDACENGAPDAGGTDDAGAAGQSDAAPDERSPARAAGGCSCRIGTQRAGRGSAIPSWLFVLIVARYVSGAIRRASKILRKRRR
jgi:hypothetical protein